MLLCSFTIMKTGSVFLTFCHATFHHALITCCNVSQSGKHLIFSQGHVTKNQPIAVPVSRNITNIDIELNNNTAHRTTITRFPGLFHFNPTHKLSQNSMKKPQRKTRAHNIFTTRPVLAYSARTCSLPYLVALALIW